MLVDLIQYWLLDPAALLFFVSLTAGALLLHLRKPDKRATKTPAMLGLFVFWLLIYLVCSSPTVVNPLLTTLEGRYPDSHSCAAGSHIVMLSGGVDSRAESTYHFEHMSKATLARATHAWRLAEAEKDVRLIVAGGAIGLVTEADVVANYLVALGIDSDRIIKESSSTNTRENALNVLAILNDQTVNGPVRLITSAMHMPRALLSFENVFANSPVKFCEVSVDRQALLELPLFSWVPQTTALVKFGKWLHELVALLIYRLRGWL